MGTLERPQRFGWVRWKGIEGSVGNAGKVTKVQLVSLERSRRLGWVRWKGLEGSVDTLERSRRFGWVCCNGLEGLVGNAGKVYQN